MMHDTIDVQNSDNVESRIYVFLIHREFYLARLDDGKDPTMALIVNGDIVKIPDSDDALLQSVITGLAKRKPLESYDQGEQVWVSKQVCAMANMRWDMFKVDAHLVELIFLIDGNVYILPHQGESHGVGHFVIGTQLVKKDDPKFVQHLRNSFTYSHYKGQDVKS